MLGNSKTRAFPPHMLYLLRKFFLCNPCVVYPELTIEQQCRCILGDDYFEINGRPFCEYHAHRYMQRPPRPPPNRGAYNGGLKAPAPMPKVERRRNGHSYPPRDGKSQSILIHSFGISFQFLCFRMRGVTVQPDNMVGFRMDT
jgi:hypothetical protein